MFPGVPFPLDLNDERVKRIESIWLTREGYQDMENSEKILFEMGCWPWKSKRRNAAVWKDFDDVNDFFGNASPFRLTNPDLPTPSQESRPGSLIVQVPESPNDNFTPESTSEIENGSLKKRRGMKRVRTIKVKGNFNRFQFGVARVFDVVKHKLLHLG